MALPSSEIKAITKLLKKPDETTSKLLEEQFKQFDSGILKEINNEIPLDDQELRNQFLKLVHKTKREGLKEEFKKWKKSSFRDLENGVFLIALFNNPLVDVEQYSNLIVNWSRTLDENLKKISIKEDPTLIINEINHFLFMELGFRGNKEDYYDPKNTFIDKVIERKLGNPILLSVIYLLVTKKLNLPFSGVNMPAHFLVQYVDSYEPIFVDPFNQGEIITRSVCQERISNLKLTWREEYLSSPSNVQIISRMLQNLINIYHTDGELELKGHLEEYMKILKS